MKLMSFLSVCLMLLSSTAFSSDNISRSSFTNGVENREPIDKIGQLENDIEKVYFFTEIKNMSGRTISHRWEYAGEVKAEISFEIGSDRWRVWSSKILQPQWLGEWIVTVIDDVGTVLLEESMTYVAANASEKEVMEVPATSTAPNSELEKTTSMN